MHLRFDHGPKFVSPAPLRWIVEQGIGSELVNPGEPVTMASTRVSTTSSVAGVLSLE
jgi:hypothetical protein